MGELFGLMNLLDNEKYACEEEFLKTFGGGKDGISLEQVQALQVCCCTAFDLPYAYHAASCLTTAISLMKPPSQTVLGCWDQVVL